MERLKEFGAMNNLTQQELGDYLGVKKSFISQIETGKVSIPPRMFYKLINNPHNWDTSLLSREQSTTISATATHDSTSKVELNTNDATIHRLTAEIAELKEQIKWYQNLIETLTKK